MLITGGPGTGKTTLAVQLLRELLAHPIPGEPTPVLFSVNSWDPQAQPRARDWFAGQLNEAYPSLRAVAPRAADALAARNLILPILDGLDEVAPERRAGIVASLNQYLKGVVLTSRRSEYREAIGEAGAAVRAAATIAPLTLTATEAASYLEKCLPPGGDPRWEGVLADLRDGSATNLRALTATPLGLWLVRTVYLGQPVADRPDPVALINTTFSTDEALRSHLLDQLIPAAVGARPALQSDHTGGAHDPLRPGCSHHPDDVRRWLTTLAEQLRDDESPDWRWWELPERAYSTRRDRLAEHLLVGLVGGLLCALVGALIGGLAGPGSALTGGLLSGVSGGSALGLLSRSLRPRADRTGGVARSKGRRRSIAAPAIGLGVGAAVGAVAGAVYWAVYGYTALLAYLLVAGPPNGLPNVLAHRSLLDGITYGLVLGLAAGLAFGLRTVLGWGRDRADAPSPPRLRGTAPLARSLIPNLPLAAAVVLVNDSMVEYSIGLAVGLLAGLSLGLASRWWVMVPLALAFGLVPVVAGDLLGALPVPLLFGLTTGLRRMARGRRLCGNGPVGGGAPFDLPLLLAAGLAFGVTVAGDSGFLFGLEFGLAAGVLGVSIGLIIWLVVGLVIGLSIALNVQLIVGEGEVISAPALALALALAVVFALSFWVRTAVDRAPPAERSTSPSQSYRNNLRRSAGISAMLVLLILVLAVLMIRGGLVDLEQLAGLGDVGRAAGQHCRRANPTVVRLLHRRDVVLPATPTPTGAVADDGNTGGHLPTGPAAHCWPGLPVPASATAVPFGASDVGPTFLGARPRRGSPCEGEHMTARRTPRRWLDLHAESRPPTSTPNPVLVHDLGFLAALGQVVRPMLLLRECTGHVLTPRS